MTRTRCVAAAVAAAMLILRGDVANGQSFGFMMDAGYRDDVHGNGYHLSSPYGGLAVFGIIQGFAEKNVAVVIPVNGELRAGTRGQMELNGNFDLMVRLSNLTVGAGMDYRYPSTPDIPEAQLGEDVTVFDPQRIGYSGSARLSLGSTGRTFIQGRYITYPASLTIGSPGGCGTEYYACRPDEYPPGARDGREMRIGVGYALGTEASVSTKILRVQFVQQQFDFEPQGDNRWGAYNRRSRMITFGIIWMM